MKEENRNNVQMNVCMLSQENMAGHCTSIKIIWSLFENSGFQNSL